MKVIINLDKYLPPLKMIGRFIRALIKTAWDIGVVVVTLTGILLGYIEITQTSKVCNLTPQYHIHQCYITEKYRIRDVYNNKWVSGLLASIDSEVGRDSIVRFSRTNLVGRNKQYGYINVRNATIHIEPQFYEAGVFSEGMAVVSKGSKLTFIDTNGNFVVNIKDILLNIDSIHFEDGCAIAQCANESEDENWGLINTKGEWILEPKYSGIEKIDQHLYIVGTEGEQGLWSVSKSWIIEPNCYSITPQDYGESFCVNNWDEIYIIDEDGMIINPFVFAFSEILTHPAIGNKEGTAITSEYILFGMDHKKVGVYNMLTNKIILPAQYSSIYMASKDIFVVELESGMECLMDKNGDLIIPNIK